VADEIRDRLTPEERAALETVTDWRDTELDEFDPEVVKDLGRHVI
jgi:hypothetical protein